MSPLRPFWPFRGEIWSGETVPLNWFTFLRAKLLFTSTVPTYGFRLCFPPYFSFPEHLPSFSTSILIFPYFYLSYHPPPPNQSLPNFPKDVGLWFRYKKNYRVAWKTRSILYREVGELGRQQVLYCLLLCLSNAHAAMHMLQVNCQASSQIQYFATAIACILTFCIFRFVFRSTPSLVFR